MPEPTLAPRTLSDRQLASIAAAEFRHRKDMAKRMIKAGRLSEDRAEEALRPWAALALYAGADLPETKEAVGGILTVRGPPPNEQECRYMIADGLCHWPDAVAALARARDKALDRDDQDAAAPLIQLGQIFPLPPYQRRVETPRKEAA